MYPPKNVYNIENDGDFLQSTSSRIFGTLVGILQGQALSEREL